MPNHILTFYDIEQAPRGVPTWGCSCGQWFAHHDDLSIAQRLMTTHHLADKPDVQWGPAGTGFVTLDTLSDAAFLDECAMRVLAGAVANPSAFSKDVPTTREYIDGTLPKWAESAYRIADAMLAERKRRREGGA